jgi:murein DD-endopeptidase MepM/ murein hydrolase activator NlpD
VSTRSYDARHRASWKASPRPRRLVAGLALPTAAAAAVTFGAAGAAVAMSNQAVSLGHKATTGPTQQAAAAAVTFGAAGAAMAMSNQAVSLGHRATTGPTQQAAAADSAQIRDRRNKAVHAQAVTAFRANAAAQVARSAARKGLAARALEAKRAAVAHGWQMPIHDPVRTSGFGWRWGRLHEGEDFAAQVGTDLVSMSTGTVVFAGQQSGFGNLVQIRYWDGTVTYYGHMSRISVTEGQGVAPGQVVGQSGNTGQSTGPHLHLEIHPAGGAAVNPMPWLADHDIDAQ